MVVKLVIVTAVMISSIKQVQLKRDPLYINYIILITTIQRPNHKLPRAHWQWIVNVVFLLYYLLLFWWFNMFNNTTKLIAFDKNSKFFGAIQLICWNANIIKFTTNISISILKPKKTKQNQTSTKIWKHNYLQTLV